MHSALIMHPSNCISGLIVVILRLDLLFVVVSADIALPPLHL